MDNQFTDLSVPDVNEHYYCTPFYQSTGFTEATDLIEQIIAYI